VNGLPRFFGSADLDAAVVALAAACGVLNGRPRFLMTGSSNRIPGGLLNGRPRFLGGKLEVSRGVMPLPLGGLPRRELLDAAELGASDEIFWKSPESSMIGSDAWPLRRNNFEGEDFTTTAKVGPASE
jgi:hypothetical protein